LVEGMIRKGKWMVEMKLMSWVLMALVWTRK
jgi:hypothetical protein